MTNATLFAWRPSVSFVASISPCLIRTSRAAHSPVDSSRASRTDASVTRVLICG
ncbi:hypothetical protein [Actinomadura bangladeshensis]|uniref:hypothetical protein n=1 Tax=Actinomadura bangladeshensis TaxID=453573 RepID=UPI001FB7832F|nr:hypothetical protein [Actinomadura bangladeshensis]